MESIIRNVRDFDSSERQAVEQVGTVLTSGWVRERLRMLARQELEAAGQPVAFLGKTAEGKNGKG